MSDKFRQSRRFRAPHVESLETRSLLSVLINAKPTLEVVPRPHRVREVRDGISILQPTRVTVTGTAQPPAANVQVQVEIYAKDVEGNILNGGAPLATAQPDFSGQYTATFRLPSTIRKDINILFAREVAVGTLESTLRINATTLSGLSGNLNINATTLSALSAVINNPEAVAALAGRISNESLQIGGLAGLLEIFTFPTSTDGVPGTAGPATGIFAGGTGTIEEGEGTLTGTGTTPASESELTGGTGNIAATGGTFTQTGTALIAATDGTSTLHVVEYAVSERVNVFIHQSRGNVAPKRAAQVTKGKTGESAKRAVTQAVPAGPRLRAGKGSARGISKA